VACSNDKEVRGQDWRAPKTEDIAQEVFVAVYQKWQNQASGRVSSQADTRQARQCPREPVVDIDETVFDSELWRWARTLPLKQRTVFALRFWGDMEGNEIARTMGISPSTVRNHLVAIRKSYGNYFGAPQRAG
jgi:DNA-directed RNA polymerase specialized sigma24 family protein